MLIQCKPELCNKSRTAPVRHQTLRVCHRIDGATWPRVGVECSQLRSPHELHIPIYFPLVPACLQTTETSHDFQDLSRCLHCWQILVHVQDRQRLLQPKARRLPARRLHANPRIRSIANLAPTRSPMTHTQIMELAPSDRQRMQTRPAPCGWPGASPAEKRQRPQ